MNNGKTSLLLNLMFIHLSCLGWCLFHSTLCYTWRGLPIKIMNCTLYAITLNEHKVHILLVHLPQWWQLWWLIHWQSSLHPASQETQSIPHFFFCKKNFWPGCRTSANLSWIVSFRTSTSLVFEGEVVGVEKDMSRLCWPILTSTVFSIFQICKRQRAQACVQRKATLNHSPDKDIKTWILLIRKRKSIALWVGQTL